MEGNPIGDVAEIVPGERAPMRIAMACAGTVPIPPVTYGNRAIYDLVTSLRKMGHTVELFNDRPPGVSITEYLANLPRAIRRFEPDAVHVNQSEVAIALGVLGPPFVHTPWAFEWYQKPHPGTWYGAVGNIRDRWALRLSDMIVAPTPDSRDKLAEFGFSPVLYIPSGVDTEKFKARNGGGDPRLALGIGIVDRRKRWELAAIALKGTGTRLRIVGPLRDPGYARELTALGAEIIGEVPEERLLEELDGCGFAVHPCDREGFAGAILQEMSFSKPVVVSAHSGHIRGTMASPSDEPGDVIRAIWEAAKIFRDYEDRLRSEGKRARESVEKNYSNEVVARQYVEVYRRYGA